MISEKIAEYFLKVAEKLEKFWMISWILRNPEYIPEKLDFEFFW